MYLHTSIIRNIQTQHLSLAELQPLTQVSLPTLRKAVQELTESRWIRVVGRSEANGGRPAMLFGVDDSYYVVLGVHLQLPGIQMIVTDMVGQVLDEHEIYQGVQPSPEEVVQAIINYAWNVQKNFPERKIVGVGIAAPGFTEPDSGDIISIGRVSGWHNFPICQRVSSALNLPTQIANDVDCMAFAEFQHSGKSFERNLAYFGFDEGVKVSLFLNGELYKGPFGNAGLIVSRFLHVTGGELPPDDQRNMLTIGGINEIFEREVAALSEDKRQLYAPILAASYRKRVMMIFDETMNHYPVCRMIINTLHKVLSNVIANIIYIIQPDTVVIGGLLSGMPDAMFISFSNKVREQLPTLFSNRVQIEKAQLVSLKSAALGAGYHFIEHYLTPDAFNTFSNLE